MVIINDDTLETETSLKLNRLNLILLISGLFVVFAGLILALIVFTPVKQWIPGYEYTYAQQRKLGEYKGITDSLLYEVNAKESYYDNILAILKDSLVLDNAPFTPARSDDAPELVAPEQDSIIRAEMAEKQAYGILLGQESRPIRLLEEIHFFCPLKGPVVEGFSSEAKHFGVDVVAAEQSPIKAALDGKVVLADWSYNDGFVIVVQHGNNLSSVYKHASVLMKRPGESVKSGDVLAIVGDTGAFSHGVHLHFELWYNMAPVDPLQYVSFD